MPLTAGTRLGPYEILSAAGAGGMGEVYRARDTRLDRTVAVKILPAHLADQPNLRQRLEREGKAVAALSHPNICTLFDVGHQEGTDFLVMEYLEGETLERRLQRGPLPAEQQLKIALEIADALEKAHRQGIIHRDLKPGNIMLTKAGAKLMDFGLARTAEQAPVAEALTEMTAEGRKLTAEGTLLGTFQYMAPEQLEGHEADARTDLFAFGEVLYEMATGKAAFAGRTKASLIAAILSTEPKPLSELAPMSPPALDRVVRTCLAKDPDERFQSAHDLKLQLAWIAEGGSQAGVPAPVAARRRHRSWLAWGLAAAALLAAIVLGALYLETLLAPVSSIHSYVLPPDKATFVFNDDSSGPVVISPDGRRLAFVARAGSERMLWIQPLNSATAQPMAGTEGATYPFWSPDSRYVGFFAAGKLKKVDASGGPPQAICDAENGRGGSWGQEGVILLTRTTLESIVRVDAAGGTPVPVTKLQGTETSHRWPFFLPDGKHFLYFAHGNIGADSAVYAASLDGKANKLLFHNTSNAVYATPGYLLFVREGTLMAQRFRPDSLELEGDAMPLAEHVAVNTGTWRGIFTASSNGLLVYQAGAANTGSQLVWYDRSGKPGELLLPEAAQYRNPAFSPDGKRLAVTLENEQGSYDIWVVDLQRKTRTRITFDGKGADRPVWSPDGKSLFYGGNWVGTAHLFRKAADGSGSEEKLLETPEMREVPFSVSSDGRYLAYMRSDFKSSTKFDLWALPLFGDGKPFPLVATQFSEVVPMISPDGKWLAYMSDESGRFEVYIRPFPAGAGKWQVSNGGGMVPHWRHDSQELIFSTLDQQLMAVEVHASGASIALGVPHLLFKFNAVSGPDGPFAVSADAKKFILNRLGTDAAPAPLTLVTNWTADIKK
jgi:serine/threonine protein kinase